MPCLRLEAGEHHHFLSNCQTMVETPAGKVFYQTNEDGFRARPRTAFGNGAFALVGDSKVEGWWINQNETVGSRLESQEIFGPLRELNLGIRYSGPSIQRLRLKRAIEHYPIKLILWFFNGTDTVDERLADSLALTRDSSGVPESLSVADATPPAWVDFLNWVTGNKSVLIRSIQMRLYDREVTRRVLAPDKTGSVCNSFRAAMREVRARKIPLIAVHLPLGPNIAKFPYMNVVGSEEGSKEISECVKLEKVPVIDLRGKLDEDAKYYWSTHRNMTSEGVRHLVEKLSPELRSTWKRISR